MRTCPFVGAAASAQAAKAVEEPGDSAVPAKEARPCAETHNVLNQGFALGLI